MLDEKDVFDAMRKAAEQHGSVRLLEPFAALTIDEIRMLLCAASLLVVLVRDSQQFRDEQDDFYNNGWGEGYQLGRDEKEKELRDKHPLAFKLIDEQFELARREAIAKQIVELGQTAEQRKAEIAAAERQLEKLHQQLGDAGMRQIDMAAAEVAS